MNLWFGSDEAMERWRKSLHEKPLTIDRKPRIRLFAGGWWICQRAGTELGRGDTPYDAYRDWLDKLPWWGVEQQLADSINRGGGPLQRAIEQRYGLSPGALRR
jgi:hypothetical protein